MHRGTNFTTTLHLTFFDHDVNSDLIKAAPELLLIASNKPFFILKDFLSTQWATSLNPTEPERDLEELL